VEAEDEGAGSVGRRRVGRRKQGGKEEGELAKLGEKYG
jgi:hypothetical protein